jgi:hypothetical protein
MQVLHSWDNTPGRSTMNTHALLANFALYALLAVSPTTLAADVLQNVPHDALGFIVLKNLTATDTNVDQLLRTLNAEYPSPLIFLKAVTGINEGLNPQGDFLFAVLPPNGPPNAPPQYCVWLPVADYDRMLTALEATPGDEISAVRVADEDLLIARHGDWALLMDPDQRERMVQLLKTPPTPPAAVAAWKSWIDENDVAAVLLHDGIQETLQWSAKPPKASGEPNPAEDATDDIFGQAEGEGAENPFAAAADGDLPPNPLYDPIRREVHKWIIRSPKLKDMFEHSDAIGCAARLDDAGNALTSLRLKPSDVRQLGAAANAETPLPPALYQQDDFILNGAGQFPPPLTSIISATYARRVLDDLKNTEHIIFDDATAARFQQAFETAASDIASWAVLTQPSDQTTGLYNNNFLIIHATSAKTFVEHASDVMQIWNKMHRDAKGATRFVFDIEESKIGERQATQYLLDVAATDNMPALPEIRQAMEKFFGPGGKMRLWLVPVDDHSVLLATATPEQVAAALASLDRKQPIDWNHPELAAANALLPGQADWRIFMSPRGHYEWHRREAEAMNGPIFGAPVPKEFAESPPIAFAGEVRDNELRLEAAIPAKTIEIAGTFFKK